MKKRTSTQSSSLPLRFSGAIAHTEGARAYDRAGLCPSSSSHSLASRVSGIYFPSKSLQSPQPFMSTLQEAPQILTWNSASCSLLKVAFITASELRRLFAGHALVYVSLPVPSRHLTSTRRNVNTSCVALRAYLI